MRICNEQQICSLRARQQYRGKPSIGVNLVCLGSLSLGIEESKASVYGCFISWKTVSEGAFSIMRPHTSP